MNTSLSDIQFEHYIVTEVKYDYGTYDSKEFEIIPDFGLFNDGDGGIVEVKFFITEEHFQLSGTVAGFFSYSKSLSESDVKSLLAGNGLAILFPYVRSTITNLTSAVNIPPLIIPTINILKYVKEKFEKTENEAFDETDNTKL